MKTRLILSLCFVLLAGQVCLSQTITLLNSPVTLNTGQEVSYDFQLHPVDILGCSGIPIKTTFRVISGAPPIQFISNGTVLHTIVCASDQNQIIIDCWLNCFRAGDNKLVLKIAGSGKVEFYSIFFSFRAYQKNFNIEKLTTHSGVQLYDCLIHAHSNQNGDDGTRSNEGLVNVAKSKGYDAIFLTPHDQKAPYPLTNQCNQLSAESGIAVCPGSELTAFWHAEPNTKDASHILGLNYRGDWVIDGMIQVFGGQPWIVYRLNTVSSLAVAAHPSLISTWTWSAKPWEWQRNRIDFSQAESRTALKGYEMGNEQTWEQDQQDLNRYLQFMRDHQLVFVTGGCDSHTTADPKDWLRWKRNTVVQARAGTKDAIMEGMVHGRTYATCGVKIKTMNCWPGLPIYQTMAGTPPVLDVTLDLSPGRIGSMNLEIYRDGTLIGKRFAFFRFKTMEWKVQFVDWNAPAGRESWYNLRIPNNELLTSPIIIRRN